MAIASFVLHTGESLQSLLARIRTFPCLVAAEEIPPGKVAAVIEIPAIDLTAALKKLSSLPGVWNLELVYVNYEDDLDSGGFIACPPDSLKDEL